MRDAKIARGKTLDETEEDLILFRSDVVDLFHSMSARQTGEIVRRKVEKSPLVCAGIDFQQVCLYIALNRDKTTWYFGEILAIQDKQQRSCTRHEEP